MYIIKTQTCTALYSFLTPYTNHTDVSPVKLYVI